MPDNKRLLELALKGLYSERERIDGEIKEVSQRLNGRPQTRNTPSVQLAGRPKPRAHGRTYSAAEERDLGENEEVLG